MAGAQGLVAVVGTRVLPATVAPQVADVVRFFLSRGWGGGRRRSVLVAYAPEAPERRGSVLISPTLKELSRALDSIVQRER
jgi:hypothetical protein